MVTKKALKKLLNEFPELLLDNLRWRPDSREITVVSACKLREQLRSKQFVSPTYLNQGHTYSGAGYACFEDENEIWFIPFEYTAQLPIRLFRDFIFKLKPKGMKLTRFMLRFVSPNGAVRYYVIFRDSERIKLHDVIQEFLDTV